MSESSGRILVVDDDPVNRKILQASLEKQGHQVETASNGRLALEALRAGRFDVVLLDLLMPEMDGYQVLEQVKQDPALQPIPVIVITALEEMASVVRCIEMGATDYLTKPVDSVLLRARLNASLAGKRLHDVMQKYLAEIELLAQQLEIRNRFIKKTFGRYLSEEVVASLLESPGGLELGGEKRKLTILMSDIRGFSPIAERLQPEQTVRLINNYLGMMADVVLEHGGTIDEFIGDSILALFGAPMAREDDARRAVECAAAMQNRMQLVNRINREQGLPEVEMGIAVNTGEVVVGNIGSLKRAKYEAVGSQVNLTARIENHTVGGQILISESTLREAGADLVIGSSHTIEAKGFLDPVAVYDLIGITGKRGLFVERSDGPLFVLDRAIRVIFNVMEGKRVGESRHPGEMIGLSRKCAALRTETAIDPLTDIKMQWFDDQGREISSELYAKNLPIPAREPGVYRIRFTSVPPEIARFCERLLPPAG